MKNLKNSFNGHEGEDVMSYVSGIANMEGGVLVIGVKDKTLEIVGTDLSQFNLDTNSAVYKIKEKFLLYTAEQQFHREDCPKVSFMMREVKRDEFAVVDGCLALVNNDFANEMKGWALVRVMGKNRSTQTIVTRCKYYERYTSEEAMEAAVKSYGGLK